jgi:hypothetical protein
MYLSYSQSLHYVFSILELVQIEGNFEKLAVQTTLAPLAGQGTAPISHTNKVDAVLVV